MKNMGLILLILMLASCEERTYRERHNTQVEHWEDTLLKGEKEGLDLKLKENA